MVGFVLRDLHVHQSCAEIYSCVERQCNHYSPDEIGHRGNVITSCNLRVKLATIPPKPRHMYKTCF